MKLGVPKHKNRGKKKESDRSPPNSRVGEAVGRRHEGIVKGNKKVNAVRRPKDH